MPNYCVVMSAFGPLVEVEDVGSAAEARKVAAAETGMAVDEHTVTILAKG